jgi:hypothetical protein
MKHEQYIEWLHLSLAGELASEERRLLDEHLEACGECRATADELNIMMVRLRQNRMEITPETLLPDARRALRDAMRREAVEGVSSNDARVSGRDWDAASAPRGRAMRGGSRVAFGGWAGWLSGFRPALLGASALAAGVFVGYLAFGREQVTVLPGTPVAPNVAGEMGNPDIANVRFVDWGARDGMVEIEYDLVRPVRLRAAVGDDRVQRVLARALVADDNPGVRIKAVGALDPGAAREPRPQVKIAIMDAAKTDPNAGVRQEALRVLRGFPFDSEIEATYLYVLEHDENAGMRVASLDLLSGARLSGHEVGPEVYQYLSERPEGDSWVKARSAVFFEEVRDE